MTDLVRIGVAGGGFIAQAAHLPRLRRLRDRFIIEALADPSAAVRDGVTQRYGIQRVYGDWRELLSDGAIDALIVCTPLATHAEITLAALQADLHVLVEKPLCITLADADRIAKARDRAGRVVQVAYQKRFDPAYERLLSALPDSADDLRFVEALTFDPRMVKAPFFRPEDLIIPTDIPSTSAEELRHSLHAQLQEAFPAADPPTAEAFASPYLDAVVHDINLVHGILERLGEPLPADVVYSDHWSEAAATTSALRLTNGAHWNTTFVYLDRMQEFRECVRLYFTDAVHSLTFAAPYFQEVATVYEHDAAEGELRSAEGVRSHADSYLQELIHFYDCIVAGDACRTPPQQARVDLQALTNLFAWTLEPSVVSARM